MLARRPLPKSYRDWNRAHAAPFGRDLPFERTLRRLLPAGLVVRWKGPFAVQPNSALRRFEYPWAVEAAALAPGMRVLEIGGGLSGFQFVLDRMGLRVTNVDPGLDARGVGWPCDERAMARLNRLFGTHVDLRNTTIDAAGLERDRFDRVFSISVIEHLPDDELASVLVHVRDVLAPGGLFVLTVDLFLDLVPFTSRAQNRFGRNVDVRRLVTDSGLLLAAGDPAELYGYEAFDPARIQAELGDYLLGSYPALAQCLVLRAPSAPAERE
jgi:SAM-dependent methyltransferase